MTKLRQTLRGPGEVQEVKSESYNSLSAGEVVGRQSEDNDLSQFGYKPELEVSASDR
jgi:hypothetical protein